MPELKYASNGIPFQKEAKKYVINMLNKSRKLHKKNCCPHSKYLTKYYDFDSFEQAQDSGIAFTKCEKCFKE